MKYAGTGPVPLLASWAGWIEASKRELPQSTQIRSCMPATGVGCQRCRPTAHLMLLLVFMPSGCAAGPGAVCAQGDTGRKTWRVVVVPGISWHASPEVPKRSRDPAHRPDHRSRRRPPCGGQGRRPARAAAPLRRPPRFGMRRRPRPPTTLRRVTTAGRERLAEWQRPTSPRATPLPLSPSPWHAESSDAPMS